MPDALRAAGAIVDVMADVYGARIGQGLADEEWLRDAGEREWVVLMKDAKIRYRPAELQVVTVSLVGETGFEPATARPPAGCATRLRHSPWSADDNRRTRCCALARSSDGAGRCGRVDPRERATGIEPALEAWKASVQPQHFARTADGVNDTRAQVVV